MNHRTITLGLFAGTATFALLAFSGCCKDKSDDEAPITVPTPVQTIVPEAPPPPPPDPEWKTKCPQAERQETGTVTVSRQLNVYSGPASSSERKATIVPGTWVNLLGAAGTWKCVDYPCSPGPLCPGWIEGQFTTKTPPAPATTTTDPGTPTPTTTSTTTATATATTTAPPTATADAGTTPTPITDAGASDARIRIPLLTRDGGLLGTGGSSGTGAGGSTGSGGGGSTTTGTGGSPPGGRPPLGDLVRPK
ncbi:MAG: hypothetical protein FWD57_00505 [Polyangiaceae bacterium]|nr:hypothetical protein [Polyangiaceae bacterium]